MQAPHIEAHPSPRPPTEPATGCARQVEGGRKVQRVRDVFSAIVQRGTRVRLDEWHCGAVLRCPRDAADGAVFDLYATDHPAAQWTTDPGMRHIGSVRAPCRPGDNVRVRLCFGKSEMRAEVLNETTGSATPGRILFDFRAL